MSVTKLETNEKIDKPVDQQTNAALTNETLDAKPAVSKQEMAANTADLTKTGTLPEISMVNKDGNPTDLYKPQRNGGENPLLDPTPIREQKGLLNKFEGPSPAMFITQRIAETKVDAPCRKTAYASTNPRQSSSGSYRCPQGTRVCGSRRLYRS